MEIANLISRASPCESTIEVASDEPEEFLDWRDKLDADTKEDNAKKHLEKIYPLEDPEDEVPTSNEWLFKIGNTKWPEEIKPFMWRYIHDRSLYRVRKDNTDAVEQLFQELKKRLHLPCDPSTDDEIRRKVERQISYVTGQWREYGLLVQNQGLVTRTAAFDKHWRHARKQWIDQVHHGITTNLVELSLRESPLPTTTTTTARIVFGDKVSLNKSPSVSVFAISDLTKEYRTKNYPAVTSPIVSPDRGTPAKTKRKLVTAERESSYEEEEEDPIISDWKPRKRKSSSAAKIPVPVPSPVKRPAQRHRRTDSTKSLRSSGRTKAPREVPEFPNLQDARSPTQTMFGDEEDMYSLTSLSSPPGDESLVEEEDEEEEEEIFRRGAARAVVRQRSNVSSPKKQTRPASSASSSGTIKGNKKSLVPPAKAKLHFIFEDSKAAQDNPVSAEIFRSSSLPEFFELARSKSFRPPSVVDYLTFRYTWGTLDAFVISRTSSKEDWAKIKKKVRNKFLIAREDLRNKDIDFEVWVTCGDTTKEVSSVLNVGDEDDW